MLQRSKSPAKPLAGKGQAGSGLAGGMFFPLRRRKHPRFEIPLDGVIRKGDVTVPCRVRNLSAAGALIEIDSSALFELNASLRIGHAADVDIPSIGTIKARPTRMHWRFAGLAFEDGSDQVGAFINQWRDSGTPAVQPH